MVQLLKLEKYVPPAIHDITLLNDYSSQDADHKNSKLISDAASAFASGQTFNVTLQDRTLYKDGDWNTLCLPFSMTEAQIAESTNPLNGATIKELVTEGDNATNLTNGTLTLMLQTVTSIEAGKPYIVKWNPGEAGIENPVFSDVTITSTGCNITAKGGKWAAGIGSGRDASGGDIVITGGTINATGGDYGAGIGSGRDGDIVIAGGDITAKGGSISAGIGSAAFASCGDITITGGTVKKIVFIFGLRKCFCQKPPKIPKYFGV